MWDGRSRLLELQVGRGLNLPGLIQDTFVLNWSEPSIWVVALTANPSKASQLLAGALMKTGDNSCAVEQLQAGVRIADQRGGLMHENEMILQLKGIGAEVPVVEGGDGGEGVGDGSGAHGAVFEGDGEVFAVKTKIVFFFVDSNQ